MALVLSHNYDGETNQFERARTVVTSAARYVSASGETICAWELAVVRSRLLIPTIRATGRRRRAASGLENTGFIASFEAPVGTYADDICVVRQKRE